MIHVLRLGTLSSKLWIGSQAKKAAGFDPGGRSRRADCRSYLPMRYVRSPASFFADSILTPCFLLAVEMNPRTLCACQSVAFMISASVAPLARAIMSRICAPLLSARGAAAFLLAPAPAWAAFFGAAALALAPGLAPLALFL